MHTKISPVKLVPRVYPIDVRVYCHDSLDDVVYALLDAQREIAEQGGVEATVDYYTMSDDDDDGFCALQVVYKSPETAMDRAQEAAKVRRDKEMRRAQYIALRAEFDH